LRSSGAAEHVDSSTHRSLQDLMHEAVQVGTERRFARLVLREDPLAGRLRAGEDLKAIDHALEAGQAAADMTVKQWGVRPEEIAAKLGVDVRHSDEAARMGSTILFSEYGDRPPTVILYTRSIAEANHLIRANHLEPLLGLDDVGPVHLAHEIYHHLEATGLTPGSRGYRVATLKAGPVRLTSGMPTLGEIAADRFAAALLGLRTPPKLTQLVTVYAHNPPFAVQLLEWLRSQPEG